MKNFLIFVIALGILVGAGSLFYYYVIFLPQQSVKSQQDINAIRNVIAPTPAQQQAQAQRDAQSMKALDDYLACQTSMLNNPKIEAWIVKQCPSNSMNVLKQMDCRSKAILSAEYKAQFECKYPF